MTIRRALTVTAGIAGLAAIPLTAQSPAPELQRYYDAVGQPGNMQYSFQTFGAGGGGGRGGRGGTATAGTINEVQLGGGVAAVTGRPFSAVEERRTVQTLGDGTKITNNSSEKFYRDSRGRTRTERDGKIVQISSPGTLSVAGDNTFVTVVPAPAGASTGAGFVYSTIDVAGPEATRKRLDEQKSSFQAGYAIAVAQGAPDPAKDQTVVENLGQKLVNGVIAEGTRSTLTIPAGQIGNDRAIKVVTERWYSPDLQTLVRSSNSDPRFGETTYDLTSIVQTEPDPSLFQNTGNGRLGGVFGVPRPK